MKVFISWSGARSHGLAVALKDWLPDVIQHVQPWLSSTDINAGARWGSDVTEQLEATSFGILCLTRDNLNAPWVLFEAGALSKGLETARVCPVLLDLEPADLSQPLGQFNAVTADKPGISLLVESLNRSTEDGALPDNRLKRAFERCWADLDRRLRQIPAEIGQPSDPHRPLDEILSEILSTVRSLSRRDSEREEIEKHILRLRGFDFPLPERLANRRNPSSSDSLEEIRDEDSDEGDSKVIAAAIRETEVNFRRAVREDGRITSPITARDIAKALTDQVMTDETFAVIIPNPIIRPGQHEVTIKVGRHLAQLRVVVTTEDQPAVT